MIVMYDSIDLSQFPSDPEAVAGYVGGHWPTYPELVQRFPHAHHLSIAVTASQRARCLDVEPGDASPAQAPGWYRNLADHSEGEPVIYGSASAVQQIINAMSASGIARDRYYIWSAHYTFKEHICAPDVCGYPQADATQWTDKSGGRNLDQSLCQDYFFQQAPTPAPTPKPIEEGDMITAVVKKNGALEVFVEKAADAPKNAGKVYHTWQSGENGKWYTTDGGKSIAWQSMGNPGG